MSVHPELAARGSFEHLKLGRLPRRPDQRVLQFAHYVDDESLLPAIPATFPLPDVLASAAWPMDGNDEYGDCTCAGAAHMVQGWTAEAGAEHTPTLDEVMALYWATGDPPNEPCQPGGPTDTGRVETDVLDYWRQTGVGGHKIGAYVAIDPANHDHLRAALYLFGGAYTGIALPETAQGQPEWDVDGNPTDQNGPAYPGSWGGHCVPYLPVWDGSAVVVVTWGSTLKATLAFNDAYTDEAYAIVSPEFLDGQGETPQGFALSELQADLRDVAER